MELAEGRAAGWALILSAGMTVAAMGHHPVHAQAAAANNIVHGLLIGLAGLAAFGFLHWSLIRGLSRPAVAAGLVAYLLATLANVGAAIINGFVVVALAKAGGSSPELNRFAWETNQALAGLGVFATGAAYGLWSIDLLRRGASLERTVGLAGLVFGLAPPVLIVTGILRMNLTGALLIYAAQMMWMASLGLLVLKLAKRRAAAGPS